MNFEENLSKTIHATLSTHFKSEIDSSLVQLQKTKKEFEGDITLVCFPFAKLAKKSPADSAHELGDVLCNDSTIFSKYNVIQGFLNLSIKHDFWIEQLKTIYEDKTFGSQPITENVVMVEYASPNTNKPLHLGHLRNIFLGDSVAHILKNQGNQVVKTQIINDRGIHICKSMLAWQRFGNGETPESSNLKGDKLVGKYYVVFDTAMRKESSAILEKWNSGDFENVPTDIVSEYKKLKIALAEKEDEKAKKGIASKMKELSNSQTPIMADVKEMLQKWEQGDKEVYTLWQKMNGWVYNGFNQTYETMNVSFDKLYYESDTYVFGKEIVEVGLSKGVFFKKSDGSVWVDLTAEGLDEKLVLRSDGTAVYMTQDIGTARQRFIDYPKLNGIIYTVGNEQDYHFKVLFLILKKLGYQWAENCYHLSYGMVDLPSGKMKSREGTVVDADDLMQEVIDKAKAMTQERGHIEGMSEEERENLYRIIGLGGLKYYLLKVDPKKRMLFDPNESVDLNGNTGPFIQYAYARISSLLKKADDTIGEVTSQTNLEPSEVELVKHIVTYPVALKDAAVNYSPALLANYTYDLVKLYNSFYQSVSIMKEEDIQKRNFRLMLSQTVGTTIKSAMHQLGIEVPERM